MKEKEFKRMKCRERDEGKGVDNYRVKGVDNYRVKGVDTYT